MSEKKHTLLDYLLSVKYHRGKNLCKYCRHFQPGSTTAVYSQCALQGWERCKFEPIDEYAHWDYEVMCCKCAHEDKEITEEPCSCCWNYRSFKRKEEG